MRGERVGLFGGTFDPPHLGHLILASEATHQLQLARVLWMLTPTPPHKPAGGISDYGDRHEMLRRALADDPVFRLSVLESGRPGPHFTVDTAPPLLAEEADTHLVLLLGGDSLLDLPRWHEPEALLALCTSIGVMQRPSNNVDLSAI